MSNYINGIPTSYEVWAKDKQFLNPHPSTFPAQQFVTEWEKEQKKWIVSPAVYFSKPWRGPRNPNSSYAALNEKW